MSIKLMATIGNNLELSSDVKKIWNLPDNELRSSFVLHGKNRYVLIDLETLIANPDKFSRKNVFVFGDRKLENIIDVICYDSVDAVFERFLDSEDSLWVIGATGKFYNLFIDKAVVMDITDVNKYYPRPFSYFPYIDENMWEIESEEKNENGIVYHNKVYRRVR